MVGPDGARQRGLERLRHHPPLTVRRDPHQVRRPEPEEPRRRVDRRVRAGADDHVQLRRPLQSVGLDVPAGAAQHLVARRRQPRHVRHRRAGHEPDAGVARQPEQLQQPVRRDVFETRHRRREHVKGGVLVPDRHEPVGRHRHRDTTRR